MTTPEAPRQRGGDDRLDRAIDALAAHNSRWERLRELFPGFRKVFLIFCLAALSWFATYTGMLELIIANSVEIGLIYRIAIAFAVATLMLMILYILDTLFSPVSAWLRVLYIFGYVLLTTISVGFGFGFFWKVLESRAESTRSAEAAIAQVQTSLQKGQVRLEQLQSTLNTLTTLSRDKAIEEREKGTSCPNSKPGDGPRRRLRDADASNFAFISDFIGGRAGAVKQDFAELNQDMAKVLSNDPATVDASGTRNAFLRGVSRKLDLTITRFNALKTDPQLQEHRDRLAARSERTAFDDGSGGTFACPDIQLQTALRGVVRAIDGLPQIDKPDVAAVEGSEAIVEAFRRLTTTLFGLLHFELPPSPDELRDLQRKAVQSAQNSPQAQSLLAQEPGLGSRDYIPLFVALFVDFCLLLVSVNRPINRFQMLLTTLKDAREGPIGEVLSRFHDSHAEGLADEFAIFQHAVFDFLGDYYVAVPLSSKRVDARYLANLLVALEGKGIVDRVIVLPNPFVRRKLASQNSDFANETAFRVYRFRNGAWSKMMLDAVLGRGGISDLARARKRRNDPAQEGAEAPHGDDAEAFETLNELNGEPSPRSSSLRERLLALPHPQDNANGNGSRRARRSG